MRPDSSTSFLVLNGFVDVLLPSLIAGGSGAITGIANFAPHACARLYQLGTSKDSQSPNVLQEAQRLQWLLGRADWSMAKGNVPGMKYLLNKLFGYGKNPRRPLLPYPEAQGEEILKLPEIKELLELEAKLAKEAGH